MLSNDQLPVTPPPRLRILVVAPAFPFPPLSGGDMRVYQLTRQLAERHDVTLLSYAVAENDIGIRELGQSVTVRAVHRAPATTVHRRLAQLRSLAARDPFASRSLVSTEMQAAINDLCSLMAFDLIHAEFSTMCGFHFPDDIPLVVDEHNIEYELYWRLARGERSPLRRAFNGLEYLRLRQFEERCWRSARGCAVTSARELPIVQAIAPATPTAVVPNGVDSDYFRPWPGETQPRSVVFNGVLNYRPNVDAATHLVEDIWPLVLARCPQARLVLVGTAPEPEVRRLQRATVDVVGRVPDIRPYLGAAEVVAVPIRIGGGTRLKVVEALAMGKPIVSTSLGSEGLALRGGDELLIADDPASFASRILELFEDSALRVRLGTAGRARAERDYSWQLAADRLSALHARVLGGSGANRSSPQPELVRA